MLTWLSKSIEAPIFIRWISFLKEWDLPDSASVYLIRNFLDEYSSEPGGRTFYAWKNSAEFPSVNMALTMISDLGLVIEKPIPVPAIVTEIPKDIEDIFGNKELPSSVVPLTTTSQERKIKVYFDHLNEIFVLTEQGYNGSASQIGRHLAIGHNYCDILKGQMILRLEDHLVFWNGLPPTMKLARFVYDESITRQKIYRDERARKKAAEPVVKFLLERPSLIRRIYNSIFTT